MARSLYRQINCKHEFKRYSPDEWNKFEKKIKLRSWPYAFCYKCKYTIQEGLVNFVV